MSYTLVRPTSIGENPGMTGSAIRALAEMWAVCEIDQRGGHLTSAAWVSIGSDMDRAEILAFRLAYRDDDPAGMLACQAVETVELPP